MATLAATTAELAWFTGRAGDLILTMAALHGHPNPTVDERRAWVLAVLIYGGSARDGLSRAINEASTGVAPAGDRRIPLATLQTANRLMGRRLVRRYGTRRGVAALGRLVPLGHRRRDRWHGQLRGRPHPRQERRRVLHPAPVLGHRRQLARRHRQVDRRRTR